MSATEPAQRLGIFAKTFKRAGAAEVAAEVKRAGFALAHWNFAAVGRPTLAWGLPDAAFGDVRAAFEDEGLAIPSVSATFNAIGPDAERRTDETRQAAGLVRRARLLGADVVTLCTGTRDPHDMWRAHPDNAADDAWRDLRATLDVLMDAASDGEVVLGIEPEPGNVVRDAETAARLLGELGDDAPIGIVFDPANLLAPDTLDRQEQILTAAADVLGPRVVSAQAKDFEVMDYELVFRILRTLPPVPLIVQDVTEAEAATVRQELMRHELRL
ncbi:TIM barrel protein [Actinospica sp. MGRD01-02]|uniref:TIM barrel protein n=1 Tax=Actinospica acidithermotolerans TaxID=2828514 RepID=A0A941EFJ0_9ACTN|nr:TIM barrel protein [Actinospica acidithermotolerans]MBR7829793.1 TIM barrel protein [Actinospica acidithermotolerans]